MRRHSLIVAAAACLFALPAAAEFSVKVSTSRSDPDAYVGVHSGTEQLELFVFTDGAANRGGEFGLTLEGAECLGFMPDTANAWLTLPVAKPYPGTIAQAKAGDECIEPPVCFGKLILKPTTAGGRIVVDVIPSERVGDAAILQCDYGATNWFLAYPAVVNPGNEKRPVPHIVKRTGDPDPVLDEPLEEAAADTAVKSEKLLEKPDAQKSDSEKPKTP